MIKRCGVLLLIFFAFNASAGKSDFEIYGDVMMYALPIGAGVIALAKDDPHGFGQMAISTTGTLATVGILKEVINRERPNGNNDNSFPSGHSASAFSGAANLHYRYGWEYGLPAYVLAFGVGWSRVAADKHYWSDVFGGLVIANVWSYVFVDAMPNATLLPGIDLQKKNYGIVFSKQF